MKKEFVKYIYINNKNLCSLPVIADTLLTRGLYKTTILRLKVLCPLTGLCFQIDYTSKKNVH